MQLPETEERWHDKFFYRAALKVTELDEDPEKTSLFSAEETREFMEQYVEGNRKIVEEYIKMPEIADDEISSDVSQEQDLFSMDFDGIQKWVPDSEALENTLVLMLGEMAIALREENKVLEERLKGLEKEAADQEKKLNGFKNKLKHPLKTTAGFIMSKGPWVRK